MAGELAGASCDERSNCRNGATNEAGWTGKGGKMNVMNVLDRLRDHFREALQAKTGWGRLEIMQEFDRAATKAVVDEHQAQEKANADKLAPKS